MVALNSISPLITVIAAAVNLQRVLAQSSEAHWQLVQEHSGANFLNNWIFYNGIDANNTGNVLFQTKEQAQQQNLTFLNSAGNYVIKVDNTTDGRNNPTFGRPSVKLLSSYTFSSGNLLLFDAVHMPYGCSVWPAFWSQGQAWPDDGEIDIVEGVNLQPRNRISLHTLNGCKHPDSSLSSSIETGTLISTDCFNQTNFNQGCIVEVPGNSYGADFAQSGGGVYAMNWNDTGIFFWFFPRGSIPADLPSASPNPDSWGLPTATYPASSCDTKQFIKPQTLILGTTICGNYAGQSSVYQQTCGSGSCLDLVQIPDNYNNAYFEIAYIKLFSKTSETISTSTSSLSQTLAATSSTSSSSSSVPSGQANQSNGGNIQRPFHWEKNLIYIFVFCFSLLL